MIEKKTVSQCISSDYCIGWNDAVDAMPHWISVEDRLPEHGRYLVITNRWEGKHKVHTATYNDMGWWTHGNFGNITHWMPMPQPSEEDDNEV